MPRTYRARQATAHNNRSSSRELGPSTPRHRLLALSQPSYVAAPPSTIRPANVWTSKQTAGKRAGEWASERVGRPASERVSEWTSTADKWKVGTEQSWVAAMVGRAGRAQHANREHLHDYPQIHARTCGPVCLPMDPQTRLHLCRTRTRHRGSVPGRVRVRVHLGTPVGVPVL